MSPRPRKHRHCHCRFREGGELVFKPAGTPLPRLEQIRVGHDEIEAVNLCDSLGLTQEEAGRKMGVSRGTVQRLVTTGRRKIISAIMKGRALMISTARDSVSSSVDDESY
jgi:predicted DNA-binding protein (UPF0251 family)